MDITRVEAGLPPWTGYPDQEADRRRRMRPKVKKKRRGDEVELSDTAQELPKEATYQPGHPGR